MIRHGYIAMILLLACPLTGQAGADSIPGDFDGDGDVDLLDFAEFQTCALGSAFPQADPLCTDARLDADEDVDLDDFEVFQSCLSGADNPADLNCACPPGQTSCDSTCVNLGNNVNCSECGDACAAGLVCQNGSCAPCGEWTADCGGVCRDILWDGFNCGFCGNMCAPVDHCSWGSCEGSCIGCEPLTGQVSAILIPGDFDQDDDVDLLDYAEFSVCLSGPGVDSGAGCASFDLDGDVDIDLPDFALFWQGFTGPPGDCPPGQGQADCGGGCIDVWWDENNCGACGNQCAPQDHCWYGSCAPCGEPGGCYGGQLFCDGACREVQLDPAYCGSCCHHCDGDQYCQGGLCWYY